MKVKSLYGILFIVLCTLGIFCVDAQQAVTMRRASFDTLSTNRAQVLDTVVVKKSVVYLQSMKAWKVKVQQVTPCIR